MNDIVNEMYKNDHILCCCELNQRYLGI